MTTGIHLAGVNAFGLGRTGTGHAAAPRGTAIRRHRHSLRHGVLAGLAALVVAALGTTAARADTQTEIDVRQEIQCLAQTIYFEARGEPDAGKLAVGHVVMNRVAAEDYPDRVCKVVRQGGEEQLHRCQFSWWCDGRSDDPDEAGAWRHSQALARAVYWNFSPDPTDGAKWYHADYVKPTWHDKFEKGPVIGRHVFYRPDETPNQPATRGPQVADRSGS